jgi:hypothetical protein
LNNFQTALNIVKAASAAAAKNNIQEAYENATRVALDIAIKVRTFISLRNQHFSILVLVQAPLVIVPRSLKSRDAFMIDLGTIIMKNQFSEISHPNESKTLTMDKITLFLYKLHVTRLVYYQTRKVAG